MQSELRQRHLHTTCAEVVNGVEVDERRLKGNTTFNGQLDVEVFFLSAFRGIVRDFHRDSELVFTDGRRLKWRLKAQFVDGGITLVCEGEEGDGLSRCRDVRRDAAVHVLWVKLVRLIDAVRELVAHNHCQHSRNVCDLLLECSFIAVRLQDCNVCVSNVLYTCITDNESDVFSRDPDCTRSAFCFLKIFCFCLSTQWVVIGVRIVTNCDFQAIIA